MVRELSPEIDRYVHAVYKKYEARGIKSLESLLKIVNDRGTYVDLANSIIDQLSDREIAALRYIWNDKEGTLIAKNRILNDYINQEFLFISRNTKVNSVKKGTSGAKRTGEYVVTREQKYNNSRHKMKKKPKLGLGRVIIIGSLVITLIGIAKGVNISIQGETQDIPQLANEEIIEETTEHVAIIESTINDLVEDAVNVGERRSTIKKICDIYQVDYDIVYERLTELTENFSSEDFLEGSMDWVTCKGENIHSENEEQLLVYAIRKIKQVPSEMGVSDAAIYINNDYRTEKNYCEQIEWAADIVGVDKCLAYAISWCETRFDSDLFNYNNNPAGIRINGEWWKFDTKQEGFLEMCMEISKYYRLIGENDKTKVTDEIIRKIGAIHCPVDDPTDIHGLNSHWVVNVIDRYQYALENEAELFGSMSQNNGLSH